MSKRGTRNQNTNNFVDYRPLYRASLENRRAWVADGGEPPDSIYPRTSDGTAVSREVAVEDLDVSSVLNIDPIATFADVHDVNRGASVTERHHAAQIDRMAPLAAGGNIIGLRKRRRE